MIRTADFSEFYRSLYPRVFRFVFAQTDAGPTDVEDIVLVMECRPLPR